MRGALALLKIARISCGSIPAARVVSESMVSWCIVEQIEGLVIEKAVVLGFCYKVMAGIY